MTLTQAACPCNALGNLDDRETMGRMRGGRERERPRRNLEEIAKPAGLERISWNKEGCGPADSDEMTWPWVVNGHEWRLPCRTEEKGDWSTMDSGCGELQERHRMTAPTRSSLDSSKSRERMRDDEPRGTGRASTKLASGEAKGRLSLEGGDC